MRVLAGSLWLVLAVVAGVDVVSPMPPPQSWWTNISLASIVTIITLLTLSIIQIITALRAGRTEKIVRDAVPVVAAIKPQLDLLTTLVDPRVLQEMADIKRMLADSSRRHADVVTADIAQVKASEHEARVEVAKEDQIAAVTEANGKKNGKKK